MTGDIHRALVSAAAVWLKKKCSVVITDMVSAAAETPDAIGFSSYRSFLIECKASRSDFRIDSKKRSRSEGRGMGDVRFYLAPAGLLLPTEIPKGWGLLELKEDGKIRQSIEPDHREADKDAERTLLISAIRRIGQNAPEGVSVKCYTLETKRTATIGIKTVAELATTTQTGGN